MFQGWQVWVQNSGCADRFHEFPQSDSPLNMTILVDFERFWVPHFINHHLTSFDDSWKWSFLLECFRSAMRTGPGKLAGHTAHNTVALALGSCGKIVVRKWCFDMFCSTWPSRQGSFFPCFENIRIVWKGKLLEGKAFGRGPCPCLNKEPLVDSKHCSNVEIFGQAPRPRRINGVWLVATRSLQKDN